ncbi:unnamed protein product [Cylicocyclus nassatus]|uniref:Uncharacterized protein n=1 Tax=Cylicocyclus nassatus TaxID=53992 RepID=A0AA36GM58_CYLNA|nr:unnamed protein product [Cylicocyclus nassatus]
MKEDEHAKRTFIQSSETRKNKLKLVDNVRNAVSRLLVVKQMIVKIIVFAVAT